MKVKELISQLRRCNSDSDVYLGYDDNIVVTKAESAIEIYNEDEIGSVWAQIKVGDVVILCDENRRLT